jgi:hypothetical protein
LKNKEDELNDRLEAVEQRYTQLNDSMIIRESKKLINIQDSTNEKLLNELKEANLIFSDTPKALAYILDVLKSN